MNEETPASRLGTYAMADEGPLVNPYIAGNPVTGREMFFGREDVFEFVRQALIGQHQDNVIVLYGQPRTGKTSILYQIRGKIGPGYLPVLIDLQALSMDGMATFLWEIASFICRGLRRDHGISVERPGREDFGSNPRNFFQEVFLGEVWNAIGDSRLVLMFDEAVRLEEQVLAGRLEHDTFGYLRHLMQHNEGLNFIFSLGSRVEEMHRDYAVLFNNGLYKKISFLAPDAIRQLITEPVVDVFQYEDDAIGQILELGGMHAYFTQLICHSVFSRYAGEWSVITAEDLRNVVPEVIERGSASFTFAWEAANPIEKLVLATMADLMTDHNLPVTSTQIRQTLEERLIPLSIAEIGGGVGNLVCKETLVPEDGYRFAVDLLRLYLIGNRRLEWVQEELGASVKQLRRA